MPRHCAHGPLRNRSLLSPCPISLRLTTAQPCLAPFDKNKQTGFETSHSWLLSSQWLPQVDLVSPRLFALPSASQRRCGRALAMAAILLRTRPKVSGCPSVDALTSPLSSSPSAPPYGPAPLQPGESLGHPEHHEPFLTSTPLTIQFPSAPLS